MKTTEPEIIRKQKRAEAENKSCCNAENTLSESKTIRGDDEKREMKNRLSRIEGQIRGISKMVEEDKYCVDILTQCAAASSAIASFEKLLLDRHIRHCVTESIKKGECGKIDELVAVIDKLL